MTTGPKVPPEPWIPALGSWVKDASAPRAGVEFARLAALAAGVPAGCAIRVDFSLAAELGSPLVILERPAQQTRCRWPASLSPRECDVVSLLATGASNKQIARSLALTEGTVKGYVHSILNKLGLPNRASVAAACRGGASKVERSVGDDPSLADVTPPSIVG